MPYLWLWLQFFCAYREGWCRHDTADYGRYKVTSFHGIPFRYPPAKTPNTTNAMNAAPHDMKLASVTAPTMKQNSPNVSFGMLLFHLVLWLRRLRGNLLLCRLALRLWSPRPFVPDTFRHVIPLALWPSRCGPLRPPSTGRCTALSFWCRPAGQPTASSTNQ